MFFKSSCVMNKNGCLSVTEIVVGGITALSFSFFNEQRQTFIYVKREKVEDIST